MNHELIGQFSLAVCLAGLAISILAGTTFELSDAHIARLLLRVVIWTVSATAFVLMLIAGGLAVLWMLGMVQA